MKWLWAGGLGCLLLWQAAGVRAEELQWRPASPGPASPSPATGPGPQVVLGRAVPLFDAPRGQSDSRVAAASYTTDSLGPPRMVVRAQSQDLPPPPPPPSVAGPVPPPPPPPSGAPGGPDDRFNCGVVPGPPPPPAAAPAAGGGFGKHVWEFLSKGGNCTEPAGGRKSFFQSDHCFDNFISPVTNPFLFEDPRALTEVRPIFMYQLTPDKNYIFKGGDIEFYGVQARLALGPRFDFVINKLGYIAMQIDDGPQYPDSSGFAEMSFGPKFTFLRNDPTKTVGAIGLNFQVPTGPSKVFQDTGSLSVVPYLSFAQSFGKSSIGCFDFMGTLGYAFSTDNQRSEYFYTSLHLDYNIANRFYPLVELNWFHYTSDGHARDLGFEGADLVNFGSTGVGGDDDNLTLAIGARYKFSECVQAGVAAEFPIEGRRDINEFRLTFDMIFRY